MQISGLRSSYVPFGNIAAPGSPPGELLSVRSGLAAPVDRVEISAAALESSTRDVTTVTETTITTTIQECADCAAGTCTRCGDEKDATELSEEEQKQVDDLKARDAEVRAHEAAHAAAGGSFAGAPSYEYQTGPDGKRYAVGGEDSIDTAPIDGDPRATIDKLRQVQAAALAPAEPSGQDKKVAQQAAAAMREAEAELSAQKQAELRGEVPDETGQPADPLAQQQVQQAAAAYQKVAALA